ncbi:MAG: tRNA (adenosine(37)-N6)-threonylcarbamoyltransferase complex ATPase subunit type 1 TsaE [Clostridiaceae bacterium]
MEFEVYNTDDTFKIGKNLGLLLKQGDIITLEGDLGTGKTEFTKGIAKGLDIDDYIVSPTFNIVNEYNGRLKLNHFDVYRVCDPDEILAIGFDEYIFSDSVSVIEWANYIEDILPKDRIKVTILKDLTKGLDYRKIEINYIGKRYDDMKEFNL